MTPNLSWDAHIEKMLAGANGARSYLLRLRDVVGSSNLLSFYKSVVRPHLEYCSPLFAGAPQGTVGKLDSFELKCLKLFGGGGGAGGGDGADGGELADPVARRREVGALTYLMRLCMGAAPPIVSADAPKMGGARGHRRSPRLLDTMRLAHDPTRCQYALRSAVVFATDLFNNLPYSTRSSLITNMRMGVATLPRCKRLIVDAMRSAPRDAGLPRRRVNAHDPHGEAGPPAHRVLPSRNNHT